MGWRDQAVCRGVDSMWWPERGLTVPVDPGRLERRYRAQIRLFCDRCPVVAECLDDALSSNSKYYDILGVRGGLTPRERASIRYRRQKAAAMREAG